MILLNDATLHTGWDFRKGQAISSNKNHEQQQQGSRKTN
jgi:hypothetical protein